MKRNLLIGILMLGLTSVYAQKFISKTGHIAFYASTPIEEIEAHNHQSASILDASTGDIQFSLLNNSFAFKNALMQEHFNENYMESEKFPKSTFKGKVTNISTVNIKKDGVYNVEVTGDLTIHGVTKNKTIPGTVEIKNGIPEAKAKFKVTPQEFNIQIPDLVKEKIAKEIEITMDIPYSAY